MRSSKHATSLGKSTGPKIQLRPLQEKDAILMLAWMQNSRVADNLGLLRKATTTRTQAWIVRALQDPTIWARAIIWRKAHVGNVVLDQINRLAGTARLSVYLGESRTEGHGVASAAIRQVLAHAYRVLRLRRIWLTVHVRNHRALASYFRLGFRVEGLLRKDFLWRGRYVDAYLLAMLKSEFAQLPPSQPKP